MAEAVNTSHKIGNGSSQLAIGDDASGDAFSLPYGFQVSTLVSITIHLFLSVGLNNFNIQVLRRGDCGFEYRARQYAMAMAVTDQLCALAAVCHNFLNVIWGQDTHTCVYVYILQHAFSTFSLCYMTAWSGDRFFQIWKPFLYQRIVTKSVANIGFTFATIFCLAVSIGQLVSWRHNPTMINECFPREMGMTGSKVWMIFTFSLPVLFMIACMSTQVGTLVITFTKIRAETKLQPHVGGNIFQGIGDHQGQFRMRYLKGIRTVLILILSTYIVALPAVTVRVVRDMSDRGHVFIIAFQFVNLTSFINTWWKFFIFLTTNKQYRSAAKQERKRFLRFLGLGVN